MKLKVKVLITTAFFLAIGLLFIENLQAQRLISGGKPRESDVEGFDKSFCVNLSNDFKVCKSANYELEETKFLVLKNNKILTTTDAPYFSAACCRMDDFWAYHGDLDKDGSQEIIISSLEGISNGMGICSYSIHIFRDPTKFASEKPFTFPVEEFGERGNFIFDSKKNETQILVTYWSGFENLDKKRGYGTYLVGKWFRYRNGLLEPIFGKPTLARRFLYSFGDEIGKTENNPYTPYLWLKSKNTHKFFTEPKDASEIISEQMGIIKNYKQDTSEEERNISIPLDSGENVEGILSYSVYENEENNNRIPITDLGLWKNKFVLPFWFDPKVVFNDFEGKKVGLETYQDEYKNKVTD